jgi:hypothetical protein
MLGMLSLLAACAHQHRCCLGASRASDLCWHHARLHGTHTHTRSPLQVAISTLTFTALQSASLCLVTTPPELIAGVVGAALSPLRLLRVPVREITLTLLLALRFMSLVGGRVREGGWNAGEGVRGGERVRGRPSQISFTGSGCTGRAAHFWSL